MVGDTGEKPQGPDGGRSQGPAGFRGGTVPGRQACRRLGPQPAHARRAVERLLEEYCRLGDLFAQCLEKAKDNELKAGGTYEPGEAIPGKGHTWLFGPKQLDDIATWLEQIRAGKLLIRTIETASGPFAHSGEKRPPAGYTPAGG